MLSEIFYWVLNMSISASIVGVVILMAGKIKKLPRRLTHALWAIPFLRMWVPVGLPGKYSLMTLISKYTTKTVVVYDRPLELTMTNHVMAASSYFPVTFQVNLLENLFRTAGMVWLIIAGALLIAFTILYWMTRSELKDATHLRDSIYVSDKITAPAAYGIFRPTILIPKGYETRDLCYIQAHEKVHIRRLDNLWRLLAFLSAAVHWFNPFAWLFLKKFLEETELACDEQVLADCGEEAKKAYATMLVDCVESKSVFASAFGGARIRVRIGHILSYRKLSVFSIISFIVFAVAIGYVLLTNAS